MLLKISNTPKYNIIMDEYIDYAKEKIIIHIQHEDKQSGKFYGYDYPASEYSTALAKFKELENLYKEEN